jgi:hypothetical protein
MFYDLTKYLFRQKTQELLYMSRELERKKYNTKLNTEIVILEHDKDTQKNNIEVCDLSTLKNELKELYKILVKYPLINTFRFLSARKISDNENVDGFSVIFIFTTSVNELSFILFAYNILCGSSNIGHLYFILKCINFGLL